MPVNTTSPSKAQIQEIRAAIDEALAAVATRFRMESIKLGSIRYDANGFSARLDAVFEGGDTPEMVNLRMGASLFGFRPEIAGAEISYSSDQYRVVGLRRTKLILVKQRDGREFTADAVSVARSLRKQGSDLVTPEDPTALAFASSREERRIARAEARAS